VGCGHARSALRDARAVLMLAGEGSGQRVSKGYISFAMVFSPSVELTNMRVRKSDAVLRLHDGIE
jgi:hypothetical protein